MSLLSRGCDPIVACERLGITHEDLHLPSHSHLHLHLHLHPPKGLHQSASSIIIIIMAHTTPLPSLATTLSSIGAGGFPTPLFSILFVPSSTHVTGVMCSAVLPDLESDVKMLRLSVSASWQLRGCARSLQLWQFGVLVYCSSAVSE